MVKLTIEEKDAVRDALKAYCKRMNGQNKASASLRDVSSGTISTILNSKYDTISDNMFRHILSQIGGKDNSDWQICKTSAFKDVTSTMADAQDWQNATWIVGESGSGKTTAAKAYQKDHKNVFIVLCSEDMKKGDFIREMAMQIGINANGHNIRTTLNLIIDSLIQMDHPLLIFDEGDKLTDLVFHYFVTLYNRLEEKTGLIFLSTDYIERRMENGLRYNKKGYKEINSRIGRIFYHIDTNNSNDVIAVCEANGITDEKAIGRIVTDAEKFDNDFRRINKKVRIEKRKAKTA